MPVAPNVSRLRYNCTRASNVVRHHIKWMLGEPGEWALDGGPIEPGQLPSWWPFWSDVLKKNVIHCVREARKLPEYQS